MPKILIFIVAVIVGIFLTIFGLLRFKSVQDFISHRFSKRIEKWLFDEKQHMNKRAKNMKKVQKKLRKNVHQRLKNRR